MNKSDDSSSLPRWTTGQVISGTLFVVIVLAGLALLIRFRVVLFVLFVAMVVSTAINPGVEWFFRRGLPRALGVILIDLLLLAFGVGFGLLIAPLILEQSVSIAAVLPKYYAEFQEMLRTSPSYLLWRLGVELPDRFQMLLPPEGSPGQEALVQQAAQVFQFAGLAARGIFLAIAVFLLSFYWTLDGERTIRSLLLLVPMNKRDGVREVVETIQTRLGNYIRGLTILCLSIGVMALIAYLVIGVPYALSLALFAALMEAVPVVGPFLGALPAAVVVLGTGELSKVIWIAIATILIQTLEGNLLVPRIMGKSVGVSPFVTLLAIAAFSSLLGVPGALLAIPIAAVIQVLLDRSLLRGAPLEHSYMESRDAYSVLRVEAREMVADVRKMVREHDRETDSGVDQVVDEIEDIASRVDQILAQASQEEAKFKGEAV